METSLVMITSVVIVNTATMILGDTTLLGCILNECLKQKLKSFWQPESELRTILQGAS